MAEGSERERERGRHAPSQSGIRRFSISNNNNSKDFTFTSLPLTHDHTESWFAQSGKRNQNDTHTHTGPTTPEHDDCYVAVNFIAQQFERNCDEVHGESIELIENQFWLYSTDATKEEKKEKKVVKSSNNGNLLLSSSVAVDFGRWWKYLRAIYNSIVSLSLSLSLAIVYGFSIARCNFTVTVRGLCSVKYIVNFDFLFSVSLLVVSPVRFSHRIIIQLKINVHLSTVPNKSSGTKTINLIRCFSYSLVNLRASCYLLFT